MSVLKAIKKALTENSAIAIVGNQDINLLPGRNSIWSHIVAFYVAPKNGLYEVKELQNLLETLLPDNIPSRKEDFFKLGPYLMFGHLFLLEEIGIQVIHTSIEIKDDLIELPDDFVDGKYVYDDKLSLMRCMMIKLFPNELIAKEAMKGNFEEKINKFDLVKYRLLQHNT